MKKTILSIILIFVVVSLTGCHGKPKNLPQEVYDAGVAASDAIDQYLDGKTDFDSMKKVFDEMSDKIVYFDDSNSTLSEKIEAVSVSNCMAKIHLKIADLIISETPEKKNELKKANKELKNKLNK